MNFASDARVYAAADPKDIAIRHRTMYSVLCIGERNDCLSDRLCHQSPEILPEAGIVEADLGLGIFFPSDSAKPPSNHCYARCRGIWVAFDHSSCPFTGAN